MAAPTRVRQRLLDAADGSRPVLHASTTAIYVDAKYLSHYETARAPTWTAGLQPTSGGMSVSVRGAF